MANIRPHFFLRQVSLHRIRLTAGAILRLFFCAGAYILFCDIGVAGETHPTPTTAPTPTAPNSAGQSSPQKDESSGPFFVTKIEIFQPDGTKVEAKAGELLVGSPGDLVQLTISDVSYLKKMKEDSSTKGDICLYLNGVAFPTSKPVGLYPPPDPVGVKETIVQFRLPKGETTDDLEAWKKVVGDRQYHACSFKGCDGSDWNRRRVVPSIGTTRNTLPLAVKLEPGKAGEIEYEFFIRCEYYWVICINIVLILLWFAVVAFSGVVRDHTISVGKMRSVSLGRLQMAAWFLVITISFIYIHFGTGSLTIINNQALALMGISALTGLSAIAIDSNLGPKQTLLNDAGYLRRISKAWDRDQLQTLNDKVQALREIQSDDDAKLKTLKTELGNIASELAKKIEDGRKTNWWLWLGKQAWLFWTDLFCDASGITIHRVQIIVWTLILIGIFIYTAWTKFTFPDFPTELLILMGLSSGSYVGFKFQPANPPVENPKPPVAASPHG